MKTPLHRPAPGQIGTIRLSTSLLATLALTALSSSRPASAQKCENTNVSPFSVRMQLWGINSNDPSPTLAIGLGSIDTQNIQVSVAMRMDHSYVWNRSPGGGGDSYNRASAKGWNQTLDNLNIPDKELPFAEGFGGTDDLRIYNDRLTSYKNVSDFPFYVITKYPDVVSQASRPNTIGLGPKSTFLGEMWKQKNIPGKGFGLEMAVFTWPEIDRANSEIVFGGYNRRKISGQVYEQDILSKHTGDPLRSPLVVNVVDLYLDTGNGAGPRSVFTELDRDVSGTSRPQSKWAFDAQLETRAPYLEFPSEIADKIRTMGNFTWLDKDNGYIRQPANWAGSLTVRLSSGLEVKLDTDLLQRAWNGSAASPFRVYQNFPGVTGFPMLGSHFMAEVYTMVNYETRDLEKGRVGTLGLARLNRNVAATDAPEYVSFCSANPPQGPGGATNTTADTIDPETSTPATNKGNPPGGSGSGSGSGSGTGTDTGVIVGAVLGGVFGLILLLALALFTRRRLQKRAAAAGQGASPQAPLMELYGSTAPKSTGGTAGVPSQELAAGREYYSDMEGAVVYGTVNKGRVVELPVKEYVHPVYTPEELARTREMSSLRSPMPLGMAGGGGGGSAQYAVQGGGSMGLVVPGGTPPRSRGGA